MNQTTFKETFLTKCAESGLDEDQMLALVRSARDGVAIASQRAKQATVGGMIGSTVATLLAKAPGPTATVLLGAPMVGGAWFDRYLNPPEKLVGQDLKDIQTDEKINTYLRLAHRLRMTGAAADRRRRPAAPRTRGLG